MAGSPDLAPNRRSQPYETVIYPLVERLDRSACMRIIRDASLPVPGKSACFCPLHRPSTGADMRRDRPGLFARACELEELLIARRAHLGRDPVWLTRFNRPLADPVAEAQPLLPDLDGNDDGGCDNSSGFT